MGTPAIVYDVDGLRDSVVDGKTGIVLRKNTPAAMAKAMEEIGDMGKKCLSYARSFDWDETALDVMKWMEGLV